MPPPNSQPTAHWALFRHLAARAGESQSHPPSRAVPRWLIVCFLDRPAVAYFVPMPENESFIRKVYFDITNPSPEPRIGYYGRNGEVFSRLTFAVAASGPRQKVESPSMLAKCLHAFLGSMPTLMN